MPCRREQQGTAAPRGSTWTKVFDLYDEGLTEHNYQAFTYDFTFANKTKDEVFDFVFRLGFRHDAFLSSAWNASLEIHQNTASGEAVAYIPDLRDYDPADYALDYFTVDGEMGYAGEELDRIYYIALLHDCGKIGVPDSILTKPGRLTDEEFEIIKSHTARGGEILSHFRSLENAGEGALYHHERYDGKGYPEGRAGEDIPLIARMICVADSFDAMNTNRVYRNKLSKERIIEEIETNKGRQFDPQIADVFLRLLREDKLPQEA